MWYGKLYIVNRKVFVKVQETTLSVFWPWGRKPTYDLLRKSVLACDQWKTEPWTSNMRECAWSFHKTIPLLQVCACLHLYSEENWKITSQSICYILSLKLYIVNLHIKHLHVNFHRILKTVLVNILCVWQTIKAIKVVQLTLALSVSTPNKT